MAKDFITGRNRIRIARWPSNGLVDTCYRIIFGWWVAGLRGYFLGEHLVQAQVIAAPESY